jgi:fido (protein-threonine AMPylation protein)
MPKRKSSTSDEDEDSRVVMPKRTQAKRDRHEDSQEGPTWTLTRDGVRTMVTGAPYSAPLVLRLENIQPLATTASQDYSYASAVICDGQHIPWSKEAYVFNKDFQGSPLFSQNPSISYIVSVTGYVTSQTNTRDSFLCLTSLTILSEEKKETMSRLRRPLQFKERTSGGVAGNFLLDRAPLFSDAQLAGSDAIRSGVAGSDAFQSGAVLDTRKAGKDFLVHHSAMKTLHESCTTETTEHAARNYMSAVSEFASAQLDRQKASLATNEGHEAADRATLVTNQHRTALEASLAHADTKQDLTIDTLKHWHSLLCGGGIVPEAGQLRTKKNRAGNTDFLPAEQVPLELDKLCKGVRALGSRLADINSAATFAAAVCFGVLDIHAFADGNGRLARISTNWALRRAGLPFVINLFATPAQRREYVTAIEMTRRNLSLVARGNVDEETLLDVTAHSGLLLPLEHLIMDHFSRAAVECSKLVAEKSLLVSEEQEAKAARRFREQAAAGSCLICFDNFPNVATLCCGKAVHLNCMAKWLSANNSCPQCRADLPSLPPRLAAPADNQDTTGFEAEDFTDDTTDMTNETTINDAVDDTTDFVDTTDNTIEDTTDQPPYIPPPARRALPECEYCRNRAATDCSNACCGRCCVIHGQFQCSRHNMAGTGPRFIF